MDPFDPATLEQPYPLYAELQRDAPVHQIAQTGIWLVSRHADVVDACARPEDFSSHISAVVYAGGGGNPVVLEGDPDAIGAVDVLATQDPPIHTAQRRLMNRTLTAARLAALEAPIHSLVDDALERCTAAGETEWMRDVANPIPVTIISDRLGLPHDDRERLHSWADAGVDLLSGVAPPERLGDCWQQMIEFLSYLRAQLADPASGSVTEDIVAAMDTGALTDREAASVMLQLVIAGAESTASLMGSAARVLAQDHALQQRLRAEPSEIPVFLEEVLRTESPFRGHFRVTTRETDLGGVTLPAGARVMLLWGAANRDPDAFPRPAEMDLARAHPKQHLAFGSGIHFCVGAPLARLEARIAIASLLERTQSFTATAPSRHVPSLFVRRPAELHLRLEP